MQVIVSDHRLGLWRRLYASSVRDDSAAEAAYAEVAVLYKQTLLLPLLHLDKIIG